MIKHSKVLGGSALIAGIAAICFWHLQSTRELPTEPQQASNPILEMVQTAEVPAVAPPPAVRPPSVQTTTSPPPPPVASLPAAPIAYGPEFDRIFKNPRPNTIDASIVERHAAMEAEPRDPVWATATEQEWHQLYASHLDVMRYGIPKIECRSTYCEIRLIAHGTSEDDLLKVMTGPTEYGSAKRRGLRLYLSTVDSYNGTAAFVLIVRHLRSTTDMPRP